MSVMPDPGVIVANAIIAARKISQYSGPTPSLQTPSLAPNAFYHVTCRGNDRRVIFRDDQDRTRFLERLRSARDIFGVRVHAYVLMSDHFHLIVETPKANLSEFMRQFNIAFTGYFNRRHRRIGHLYQGRFKAMWWIKTVIYWN